MNQRIAALALVTATLVGALPAAAMEIATHRAFYRLSLVPGATAESAVLDVQGGMSFEWTDTCDGWTNEQRYVMRFSRDDGTQVEVATSYVTWESKDGLDYRFNVKRATNGVDTEVVSGHATLDSVGGPGMARFEQPATDNIALSAGTIFPTEHSLILLKKAIAGEKVDRHMVFDGAEVEGAAPVTTIIMAQRPAPDIEAMQAPLGPYPVWPMQIAFYAADGKAGSGEELPDFELALNMQENGIVTAMTLGFDGFKVLGTMERIEAIPRPAC